MSSGALTLTGAAGLTYLVIKSIYDQSSTSCWGKICRGLGQCLSGKLCRRVPTSIMDPYFPEDLPGDVKMLLTLMGRSLHQEVESLSKGQRAKAAEESGTREKPVFQYDLPTGTNYTFISLNTEALQQEADKQWQEVQGSMADIQDYEEFSRKIYSAFKNQSVRRYMSTVGFYHDSYIPRIQRLFNEGSVRLRVIKTQRGEMDVYMFGSAGASTFNAMYILRVERTDTQGIDFFGNAAPVRRSTAVAPGTTSSSPLLLSEVEMGAHSRRAATAESAQDNRNVLPIFTPRGRCRCADEQKED